MSIEIPTWLKKALHQPHQRMHKFWFVDTDVRIESRPCLKFSTAWSKKEYSLQPGSNGKCVNVKGFSNEAICQPDVSEFINQILNHHTRITMLNAHHRFRIDHVISWSITWKRSPFLLCREGGEIGWLYWTSKAVCPQYWWNGWRTDRWLVWGSSYLK